MAELRLLPLEDVIESAELRKLEAQLREIGIGELPAGEDVVDLDDSITNEHLEDFFDRLEAHDVACDIYLPVEFDAVVEVGDYSVGSVYALSDALDEIRDELDVDSDEDEEEEEDDDVELEVKDQQLNNTWKVFSRAAAACIKRQVPLHIIW